MPKPRRCSWRLGFFVFPDNLTWLTDAMAAVVAFNGTSALDKAAQGTVDEALVKAQL